MYEYVRRPNAAFADLNLDESAAENLQVSVWLVLDNRGKVVFLGTSGASVPPTVRQQMVDWIAAHAAFAPLRGTKSRAQGIIVVPDGILLAVARPILNSEETLPEIGTLVMARLLDAQAVSAISRGLALAIGLEPLQGSRLSPAEEKALSVISPSEPLAVDTTNGSILTAWTVLSGAANEPAVLLRVDTPRDIRTQGVKTIRYFLVWLVIVGAAFAAVVLFAVERTVLARIGQLSAGVLTIGTSGLNAGRRISIGGKDQVAYLGAAINGMLDALERSTEELRASERRTEAFLDAMPDVIFRVTRDGTITDARSPSKIPLLETANDLVGRDPEQILPLYSFLSPEHFPRTLEATAAALDTGVPQILEFQVDADGGRRSYEERFVAAGGDEAIVIVREVTAQKQAEETRRQGVLLKEIHHRVKNNLQVISSLLSLQARSSGDKRTAALLQESRDRVRSMALIHEKLYQTGSERGVSFAAYVRDLAAHLRHSYAGNSESVQVRIDVEDISLDLDLSVPCGLIITELLSNALKHAFPAGRTGTVTVSMAHDGPGRLRLGVSDDGIGLPQGVDVRSADTLGLRIVTMLVEQIKGTLSTGTAGTGAEGGPASAAGHPGPGASFSVSFPWG
jgi:two-component sensor histidine kinase/sensor domain CHASE-containing protein